MASNNKTFIQKAIDKTLKSYESPMMGFLRVEREEIENLRKKLYAIIAGNESEYLEQVNDRLQKIEEKIILKEQKEQEKLDKAAEKNFGITKVRVLGSIPSEKTKLQKDSKSYKNGKIIGFAVALATVGTIVAVSSCGAKNEQEESITSPIVLTTEPTQEKIQSEPIEETVPDKQKEAERIINQFAISTSENTTISLNTLLANGVRLVEFDTLTEEQQKELIASMGLQYYLVANIDDITTLEYANFMKEQPNAVLDNDDLIYNFRNLNVLLKQQMLVSMPDNKIDFTTIYQNELDAKLLNDGADLIARLNSAENKNERKEVSKEIYDYIQNTLLNSTSELKYSNSAMSTFINVEFGAWEELTKNSHYSYGYYPDDELEAKLMTVVSNCGMSEGEKAELDLQDSTKTSLESINVIRVLNTLESRKENILILKETEELYFVDGTSYGDLKQTIIPKIDLTKYHEMPTYTEKKEEEIINTPKVTHPNDSGVSNGQGGTIANNELEKHDVNPSSPTAKQEYEQSVQNDFEQKAEENKVVKNEQGEVIDPSQAAAWAQQGAIDANNGTKNNNVPSLYQEAYNNGWNAANEAKKQAEQAPITEYVPIENPSITEEVIEETKEDFKEPENIPSSEIEQNPNIESETTFIPVEDGDVTEIIIEETVERFAKEANEPRVIEVQTLTRKDKLQTYKDIKALLQQINNSFDTALNIYNEIEENHMTK